MTTKTKKVIAVNLMIIILGILIGLSIYGYKGFKEIDKKDKEDADKDKPRTLENQSS